MKSRDRLTEEVRDLTGQVRALNTVLIGPLHYIRPEAIEDPAMREYLDTMSKYAREQRDTPAARSLDLFLDGLGSTPGRKPPGSMVILSGQAEHSN